MKRKGLTLRVLAVAAAGALSLWGTNWAYPLCSDDKAHEDYLDSLAGMRITDIGEDLQGVTLGASADATLQQNRVLNFLLDQSIKDMKSRHVNSRRERYLTFALMVCVGWVLLILLLQEFGLFGRARGYPIAHLLMLWRTHWEEITIAVIFTSLALGLSMYVLAVTNGKSRSEFLSSSGLPFVFLGTLASVLGCTVTVLIYRTLRHRLVSWPALLADLRRRIDESTEWGGSPSDYQLDALVYSPNVGQISMEEGSGRYQAFLDYRDSVGTFRKRGVPTRFVCFTNASIHRMIDRFAFADDGERQGKLDQTMKFMEQLEEPFEEPEGLDTNPSLISVWRHGGIPNTHFYYGGHQSRPSWCIRFLVHREQNGKSHEVNGFDTQESMELEFASEVFEEYLREIACPVEIGSIALTTGGEFSIDARFYAQTGVGRLKVFANENPKFRATDESLMVEIDLENDGSVQYLSWKGEPAELERAHTMRLTATVSCRWCGRAGQQFFIRGEFVKRHNERTCGASEVWMESVVARGPAP